MQGDDPPFLPVGTDVSAKYKGAFCEAKIKKVVRNIKCKVTPKAGGGTITVNDDAIKGTLRVGCMVEVKQDPKKDAMEAVISKIQDCSQYTVVFDDGDITTLRRSALCLKSGRHFNESETLDQLPLTHPEHFSTPVIAGRRGRRGRAQSEESEGDPVPETRRPKTEREPHVGRVVLVEAAGGAERRRPHQPAFPALVVTPTPQINVKEDYLVRSFKDGRYYTVPKKEAREFRKGSAPLEWSGVEAALQYLNNGALPPHWDRDALFNEPRNTSDDSSDDEPREEKDHFVAQLYKFMDDRGTPLNRNPTIANRDIDLYRLFRVVQKLGGYNRVTNQNQWKVVADKMGFHPVTTSITNLCKQAYKKFLHSFEDFYRKLGVTLVAHPRGARTPPAGRSLIRDRDKQPPTSSSASSTPTGTPNQRGKDSDKSEAEKSDKSEKDEKIDKPKDKARGSDEEDSADNQPLVTTLPKIEKEKKEAKEKEKKEEKEKDKKEEKEKEKKEEKEKKKKEEKEKEKKEEKEKEKKEEKEKEKKEEKEKEKKEEKEKDREKEKPKEKDKEKEKDKDTKEKVEEKPKPGPPTEEKPKTQQSNIIKPRSQSKTRSLPPIKSEHEKRLPKRRPPSSKSESPSTSVSRASRRPHVSTDSDSSGRASRFSARCGLGKKMASRRSQSVNSASSGNTIASNSSKRPRKRKITEPSTSEPIRGKLPTSNVKAQVGDKLKVYYGPTQSTSKVTYEAKVTEIAGDGTLRVHYTGWNTRYDEWINPQRIALNVTQHEQKNKKQRNTSINRRMRAKRTEESSARSDTDSDSDSEVDVKKPPKKLDDKPNAKTPLRSKDAAKSSDSSTSSKPRKRPVRTTSTPSNTIPIKKTRPNVLNNPGRDYDLNEIRSELKGLHKVKQEPEDTIKQEPKDKEKESPSTSTAVKEVVEPPQPVKQPEDVYEFKEPEPFELELHDEKKKRTHRIFDDISPSKYTSTLAKSFSEEIAEDPLRPKPPALSPFREFASTREAPVRKSLDEDSKDDVFSMDDDSFQDGSGVLFEGFTPAKNQETYSKRNKVSKLRELIDDSPDSPADDEESSEDEDIIMKDLEDKKPSPVILENPKISEKAKTPEPKVKEIKEEPKDSLRNSGKETKMDVDISLKETPKDIEQAKNPAPPTTTPSQKKYDLKKIEPLNVGKRLGTPSANKKLETPISKKVETPAACKKVETPAASKKVETPASKKGQTPTACNKVETPASKVETPTASKKVETPASKKVETPASKKVEAPAASKKIETVAASKKVEPPASKKVETPASKKVETPASKKLETPASKKAETPASNKVETPAACKKVETPTASKKVDTIVSVKEDSPPTSQAETSSVTTKVDANIRKNDETPSSSKKVEVISISNKKNEAAITPKKVETPSTRKNIDIPTIGETIEISSITKKIEIPNIGKNIELTSTSKITELTGISFGRKLELPSTSIVVPADVTSAETKAKEDANNIQEKPKKEEDINIQEKPKQEEDIKQPSIPLPAAEPQESTLKMKIDEKIEPVEKKVEPLQKIDPFVKKMDPIVKKMDPIVKKMDPFIKKMDPIVKKLDPIKKMDLVIKKSEPSSSKLEIPSSPIMDTEEEKSEPDSPARIDAIPEPPPGFLLQSEGPKIAEKLLKAINSAKRLSMSPPPFDDRPKTPKKDLKLSKPERKSPVPADSKKTPPPIKLDPKSKVDFKKVSPIPSKQGPESVFGEPSNITDAKRDTADVKKVKPKDPTPPRLQSPLNILERRKSVVSVDLPLASKNNKVLSDTIQKLSSQINQAAANITLPPFPTEDKSESSDSDDSNQRRLIIDKLSVEEWANNASGSAERPSPAPVATRALHAGKSPGEWSAGETLLMLEDACKNERKHSASVVVAGRVGTSGTQTTGDDDSNISLLLCSETIPGSPAPDAEPAPPKQRLHMPFACAPPHHQHKAEERRPEAGAREGASPVAGAGEAAPGWARRHALVDNTPPTTPDSSLDMSPRSHRDRRMSERDSPSERKEEEDESRPHDVDMEKLHGARSRKASESSGMGTGRGRRARREVEEMIAGQHPPPPLKYNFYIELDPAWDSPTRINVLTTRLADLRKAYHSVKAELAAIDRRRKKLRRKEREAVKAAKAACS